jgi:hypothetical protein
MRGLDDIVMVTYILFTSTSMVGLAFAARRARTKLPRLLFYTSNPPGMMLVVL